MPWLITSSNCWELFPFFRSRRYFMLPKLFRDLLSLVALLRGCPASGVERTTHPTQLAYVERGNPVAVWCEPVTPSQERANPVAGTGGLKKQRPARRKAREKT